MHSPFTKAGRLRIKKTFLASGPAAARFPEPCQPEKPQSRQGWRFGSSVARYAVESCLAINVLFLILACALSHVADGVGILYEGDCRKAKNIDTWIHVLINGLATALVGASNYTMQCLAAPNRSEVDAAHAKGVWLDIGVPSLRNLRHIEKRRVALWVSLAVSTIPIHLMWNSVIFSTIQDNVFVVVGASTSILQDSQFNCSATFTNLTPTGGFPETYYDDVVCNIYEYARAALDTETKSPLTRLEAKDCVKQYNTKFQSKWSNVVVVFDEADVDSPCVFEPLPSNTAQIFAFQPNEQPDGLNRQFWFDPKECAGQTQPLLFNTEGGYSGWYIKYPIKECLAMESSQSCRLEFSLPTLLIVILCNAIKLLAIINTVKLVKEEHFMTLGDAIASFLEVPDRSTVGQCLSTKRSFQKSNPQLGKHRLLSFAFSKQDTKTRKGTFWFRAPSVRRWYFILAS